MNFDEFFEEAERIGMTGDDLRRALESSRSPGCYARFEMGNRIRIQKPDGEKWGKFVGVDKDGVVTYLTSEGEYLTAWDCNVYSA